MANALEYIERYFTGNLSDEEKAAFEMKCETDSSFAEEVAFYISARRNIRKELFSERKREFDEIYLQLSSGDKQAIGSANSHILLKILRPYFTLAAACLLLVLGWMVFFKDPSPQQLATNYIKDNLQYLSIPMNDSQDSLQMGIAAYNQQDYSSAEKIFSSLAKKDHVAPEAIRNLGIIYLVTEEYNKALMQFDSLSAYNNLHANPGLFFKAVTLMKRAEDRDREEAKMILQEIIDKRLPGSMEAKKWIKDM